MSETAQQYTKRILSYSDGIEPLQQQESTPQKLAELLRGKDRGVLRHRPSPDKWSVAEVVAHLADAEIAMSWRIRQILTKNAVAIQAYDQNAWASTFDYADRDPYVSLELFRALRSANIALLKSVPRELWDNYGVHEERGNESIAHIVRMVAGHDLNHLRQIEAILK
jgi:DinB superfamily